jgi:hypothetical protein
MRELVVRSARVYEKLLFLYPEDLRREFGGEMALAFADDIESAWSQRRAMGVIQVWWWTLRELVMVGLPGQASNPSVAVPALSFALCALTQSAELWIGSHQSHRVEHVPLADAILLVLLPSLLNGFVAFIVTRFYARCSIIMLQLD